MIHLQAWVVLPFMESSSLQQVGWDSNVRLEKETKKLSTFLEMVLEIG